MNKIMFLLSIILLFGVFETKSSTIPSEQLQNFGIDDRPYQKQASEWIKTHIFDCDGNILIPSRELQLIANLIYTSFRRSLSTLEAQEKALKSLDIFWKGWQNIAQTRLDPSVEQPYEITAHDMHQGNISQFWHIHDRHRNIGLAYSHAVKNIADGKSLVTACAKDGVTAMRSQARTVVAKSLMNVKNYLGKLFHTKKGVKRALSFVTYMWEFLPKLALNSFVEANKTNDTISEEGWNVLMKIQHVGKQTWQTIEQDRASFYLAFYKAIWHSMKKLNIETNCFKILFDQNGPICIDNQVDYLPEPAELEASCDMAQAPF